MLQILINPLASAVTTFGIDNEHCTPTNGASWPFNLIIGSDT